jgi:hypothetical protein
VPVFAWATRGEGAGAEAKTGCVTSPLKLPLGSSHHAPWNGPWIQLLHSITNDPCRNSIGWGPDGAGHPRTGRPFTAASVLLLANFLARALASERCFYTFLLAGLEVKGVALHFFNNVFLLHFALEAAQSVLKGFTLLQSDFRQTDTPPNPSGRTEQLLQGFDRKSSGGGEKSRRDSLWNSPGSGPRLVRNSG